MIEEGSEKYKDNNQKFIALELANKGELYYWIMTGKPFNE